MVLLINATIKKLILGEKAIRTTARRQAERWRFPKNTKRKTTHKTSKSNSRRNTNDYKNTAVKENTLPQIGLKERENRKSGHKNKELKQNQRQGWSKQKEHTNDNGNYLAREHTRKQHDKPAANNSKL